MQTLGYYGGKQKMARFIVDLMPKHNLYVEPFFGTGAVFFAKPIPQVSNAEHYKEVINDKDEHIYNFFVQLRDNGEALYEKIMLTPYSESEYRLSLNLDTGDDLERARRFFVNSQQSFANGLGKGWKRGMDTRNHANSYYNKVEHLPAMIARIRNAYIHNTDAMMLIEKCDSPTTLFYLDPPYPNTSQGHYRGYSLSDYKRLVDLLANVQGAFILSNYLQDITYPTDWVVYTKATKSTIEKVNSKKGFERMEHVYVRGRKGELNDKNKKLFDSNVYDCFRG